MTDKLTPEEREALKNLPRERMPGAALEGRVVNAMREHGFLARPRRTIAVTGGRVATLVAASVALMIGAYSIGLHRGGSVPALSPVGTPAFEKRSTAETMEETPPPKQVAERPHEAEPPAVVDAVRKVAAESPEKKAAAPAAPAARSDEADRDQAAGRVEAKDEGVASNEPASPATEAVDMPPPPPASGAREKASPEITLKPKQSSEAARPAASARSQMAPKPPLTFMLNGVPVTIEAPDSVRVTEDELGKMLLIYTSDGIIRVRLGDGR